MTLRKDSLVFGIFMTIVLPMAWSAPLPFGALDEKKPVVKKVVPTPTPAPVSKSPPVVSSSVNAYRVGQELKDCDICPVLVVLPKGDFIMGSPVSQPRRSDDEGPQHKVKVNYSLAVGKYEVTQGDWQALMGSNPSVSKSDQLPVGGVSWDDAKAYVKKLNDRTGNKYKFRLLSEAEWEYAARAGTNTLYSTGQQITANQANFEREGATKVGSFAPNAWGLYDMHGNVREWVEDVYHDSYAGAPKDGSAWVIGVQNWRVMRGGGWNDFGELGGRSANRSSNTSHLKYGVYGFRLARTL